MSEITAATGSVIARAIIAHARQGAFGVLVKDMPEFDPESLLEGLATRHAKIRFRVAMPGYAPKWGRKLRDKASTLGFDEKSFVTTVEGAERWRNDVKVKETIVVIAPKEIPKLNSLNRFRTLRSDELYEQVCQEGRTRFGVNDAQRQLWKALEHKKVRKGVPLEGLLAFFSEMEKCLENEIPERSRQSLYLLGLLPDPDLFTTQTSARIAVRLEENQKTVDQLEVLTRTDRQRISKALASKAGTEAGQRLQEIYLKVMAFYREQSPARLQELTLRDVNRLLKSKIEDSKKPESGATNSEELNGEDSAIEKPTHSPTVRAMDLLLEEDDEALAALGEVVQAAILNEEEDEEIEPKDPETGVVLDVDRR